jgi:hypothetical protein
LWAARDEEAIARIELPPANSIRAEIVDIAITRD